MRFGIIVDATCDLPAAFFEQNPVEIMPVAIRLDGKAFSDTRDTAATIDYYRSEASQRGHEAETTPFTVDQIHDLFIDRLVVDYDCVFCLTVAASRSKIFERASEASYAILRDYRRRRREAGVEGPFLMRVVDTRNVFAAQGVTALEAVRMFRSGASPGRVRERLESLANHTYTYVVLRDVHYIRARTRHRGERSVSFLTAAIGGALDIKPVLQGYRSDTKAIHKARGFEQATADLFGYVIARVQQGLLTKTLCLSYGGDLEAMRNLPNYDVLREVCRENRVQIHESVMSITGMVNVGTGGISLGFAAEPHDPVF